MCRQAQVVQPLMLESRILTGVYLYQPGPGMGGRALWATAMLLTNICGCVLGYVRLGHEQLRPHTSLLRERALVSASLREVSERSLFVSEHAPKTPNSKRHNDLRRRAKLALALAAPRAHRRGVERGQRSTSLAQLKTNPTSSKSKGDNMQNVTTKVQGDKLTITCDLKAESTPSASGKTQVVASTRGNVAIASGGRVLHLGLNLYEKNGA